MCVFSAAMGMFIVSYGYLLIDVNPYIKPLYDPVQTGLDFNMLFFTSKLPGTMVVSARNVLTMQEAKLCKFCQVSKQA